MSILKRPINYEDLEEELQEAIKGDTLYKLQNDAKIRALEQHVPTYEDFRQMVNGAHLRPLDKKDTIEKNEINWNRFTEASKKCQNSNLNYDKKYKELSVNKFSRDGIFKSNKFSTAAEDFNHKWRLLNTIEDKFNFLMNMRNSLIKIFTVEIPTDILSEILDTCLKSLPEIEDSGTIVDVLTTITRCNRFQLAVTFMSNQDKLVYEKLFNQLIERNQNNNEEIHVIIDLAEKYQMNCKVNQGK